jgi:hypothetical protein
MYKEGKTLDAAYKYVKEIRERVEPDRWFIAELKTLELLISQH